MLFYTFFSFCVNPNIITHRHNLWPLVIFLVALLPRVFTLEGTFITTDEGLFWEQFNTFALALSQADWAGTLVGKGYPYITVAWAHLLGFMGHYLIDLARGFSAAEAWTRLALDQPYIFDLIGPRRLTIALLNSLLIVWLYRQARRLLTETIAVLGTILMAFAPILLADARTMRGDALMCSFMLMSVLGYLIFLKENAWGQLVLSAICFGLAVLTKISALPVVGFVGLVTVFHALYTTGATPTEPAEADLDKPILRLPPVLRNAYWHIIKPLLTWSLISGLTLFLLWPALWVVPLEALTLVHKFTTSALDGRLTYFWGQLYRDNQAVPLFYPVAFAFRATPFMLLGCLIFIGLALSWFFQIGQRAWRTSPSNQVDFSLQHLLTLPAKHSLSALPRTTQWTLLALALYVLIFALAISMGALKRDRYLMPIYPATAFLAAAGLWWLFHRLTTVMKKQAVWGLVIILLTAELIHIFGNHPYYYTYWNPLLGGGRVAMTTLWAEGGVDSAALVQLSQQPDAADKTIAMINLSDFLPAFAGSGVRLVNNSPWITADYIVLRQYHFQTEKLEPSLLAYIRSRPLEFALEVPGYTWAWVYPGPAAQHYAGSSLDGKAYLHGYNLSSQILSASEPLPIKLFWQNRGLQPSEQIYVRLVDATGFTWLETIAQPQPEFAEAAGQVEAYIESEAELILPPGTPPGQYFLKIGLMTEREEIGQFELPAAATTIAIEPSTAPVETLSGQPLNQPLGPSLRLLTADLPSHFTLTPPTPQPFILHWRAETDIQTDYTVAVQLWRDNQEIAYWLDRPTHGLYPTQQWRQEELVRDIWQLDLAAAQTKQPLLPGRYQLGLTLFDGSTSQQQVAQTKLGPVELIEREHRFIPPPMQHRFEAIFADQIHLLGFDLTQRPLTGYAALDLQLYWQTQTPLDTSYTIFTQLLGPDGTVIGQHDGLPAEGNIPTTEWQAGEIIADRHTFDHPTDQVGHYRLIVGLYNSLDGSRLPVTDPPELGSDFVQLYSFRLGGS